MRRGRREQSLEDALEAVLVLVIDRPEPTTLEMIARQLVEEGYELDKFHASMRPLYEMVGRIDTPEVAERAATLKHLSAKSFGPCDIELITVPTS
jgi:hypothetical protein